MSFDKDRLYHALCDSILESDWGRYDFDSLVNRAEECWDGTAVCVKLSDRNMIFDKISYELCGFDGCDLSE